METGLTGSGSHRPGFAGFTLVRVNPNGFAWQLCQSFGGTTRRWGPRAPPSFTESLGNASCVFVFPTLNFCGKNGRGSHPGGVNDVIAMAHDLKYEFESYLRSYFRKYGGSLNFSHFSVFFLE